MNREIVGDWDFLFVHGKIDPMTITIPFVYFSFTLVCFASPITCVYSFFFGGPRQPCFDFLLNWKFQRNWRVINLSVLFRGLNLFLFC